MGRPKGSLNKTTSMAKEAFQLAFNKLGGFEALYDWGNKNKTEFYKLYSKLIPADTNVNMNGAVKVDGTIKYIRPDN